MNLRWDHVNAYSRPLGLFAKGTLFIFIQKGSGLNELEKKPAQRNAGSPVP